MKGRTFKVLIVLVLFVAMGNFALSYISTKKSSIGNFTAERSSVPSPSVLEQVHHIGGTVSGFSGNELLLVLNNDDASVVTIKENGTFVIPSTIKKGETYELTAPRQPLGQTCEIQNGKGTFSGQDISNIAVKCSPWTKRYGSKGDPDSNVSALTTDEEGNVYVVGNTSGFLADQGPIGDADAFLIKYTGEGRTLIIKRFGEEGLKRAAQAVAADKSKNIYIVGYSKATGSKQVGLFLIKMNETGKELYTKYIGEMSSDLVGIGQGVTVDKDGYIYVVGNEKRAFFLKKFDPDGNEIFTKQETTLARGDAVATDSNGNVVVAGTVEEDDDLTANRDIFVIKFDPEGNQLFEKKLSPSGRGDIQARAIAIDAQNNIVVVGLSAGDVEGEKKTYGTTDSVVVKYNENGDRVFVDVISIDYYEVLAGDVTVDAEGNILVVGSTNGAFKGERKTVGEAGFLIKYDRLGNRLFTREFGQNRDTWANAVSINTKGEFFIGGVEIPFTDSYGFVAKFDRKGHIQ